jgi:hypothetical protein
MACRHYVCGALRIITENTAKVAPEGRYLKESLSDILTGKDDEEERTSEEIISDIKKKLQ